MSIIRLCDVDIADMRDWIIEISFDEWHQSAPGRPCMMTDLNWKGFGEYSAKMVEQIAPRLPYGARTFQHMLSVVMPYEWITPHRDGAPYSDWITRVHVPLTSNDMAWMISDRQVRRLLPGSAYKVDMTVEHAVTNGGDTPRIHYMFDVRAA